MSGSGSEICPFCSIQIAADLARFGGTCPGCLGEIPGDEAATDPGEQERKRQEAADAKRKARRASLPLFVMVPAALGVVGFAAWAVLRPDPEAEPLNLDDGKYWQADLDSMMVITGGPTAEVAEEDHRVASAEGPKLPGAPSGPATYTDPLADIGSRIQTPGAADAAPGGPRAGDPGGTVAGPTPEVKLGGGSATGGDPFADIGVSVARKREKGVTLTNDNDIVEMVKAVMSIEYPKLKICYDRRLKEVPDLQGDWLLKFTVTSDGTVRSPSASGAQRNDPALEACISEKIGAWQFQPIKADLPFQRTIRFVKPS